MVIAQMTEEQRQKLDEQMRSPEAQEIMNVFMQNSGITQGDVVMYAYKLLDTVSVDVLSVH